MNRPYMMRRDSLYINGEWVEANGDGVIEVVNPATEETIGSVPVGSQSDVDAAVTAARDAFTSWSMSSIEERIEVLNKLSAAIKDNTEELAQTITAEVGTPIGYSRMAMVGTPRVVTRSYAKMLESYREVARRRQEELFRRQLHEEWRKPGNSGYRETLSMLFEDMLTEKKDA